MAMVNLYLTASTKFQSLNYSQEFYSRKAIRTEIAKNYLIYILTVRLFVNSAY